MPGGGKGRRHREYSGVEPELRERRPLGPILLTLRKPGTRGFSRVSSPSNKTRLNPRVPHDATIPGEEYCRQASCVMRSVSDSEGAGFLISFSGYEVSE